MICLTCGETLLFGWRNGVAGWLHRGDPGHRGIPTVPPDRSGELPAVPDPEVRAVTIGPDDERVPGGARSVRTLMLREGWTVDRLTYARGPRLGAGGKVLSTSDSVVLGGFDSAGRFVVASWTDGGFDFAYVWVGLGFPERVNSSKLKGFIRERNALPEGS